MASRFSAHLGSVGHVSAARAERWSAIAERMTKAGCRLNDMNDNALDALQDAFGTVLQAIFEVPDKSLEWQKGDGEFSVKQIIAHLTSANDFYLAIVEDTIASNFGEVRTIDTSPGYRRMYETDALAMQCKNTVDLAAYFEQAFVRLRTALEGVNGADLDKPFIYYGWQKDEPYATTLRQRVIAIAAEHMIEHKVQLEDSVTGWKTKNG